MSWARSQRKFTTVVTSACFCGAENRIFPHQIPTVQDNSTKHNKHLPLISIQPGSVTSSFRYHPYLDRSSLKQPVSTYDASHAAASWLYLGSSPIFSQFAPYLHSLCVHLVLLRPCVFACYLNIFDILHASVAVCLLRCVCYAPGTLRYKYAQGKSMPATH